MLEGKLTDRLPTAVPSAAFDWSNVIVPPETVNVTVVVCVTEPLVPVIVSVYDPVCAEVIAAILSVEEPEPVIFGGLKLPVTPGPKPLRLRLTTPVNPF